MPVDETARGIDDSLSFSLPYQPILPSEYIRNDDTSWQRIPLSIGEKIEACSESNRANLSSHLESKEKEKKKRRTNRFHVRANIPRFFNFQTLRFPLERLLSSLQPPPRLILPS